MCLGSRVGSRGSEVWAPSGRWQPRGMARDWAGFSEEELRRLKQSKDPFEPQRRLPVKKSRQQLQREKALQEQSQKLGLQDGSSSVPPEQLLSAPEPRFNAQNPHSSSPVPPSPLTVTSPVGDGKPQGTEGQPSELGLENSHDGRKNTEVLPPKSDCKMEKKKLELLVLYYEFKVFPAHQEFTTKKSFLQENQSHVNYESHTKQMQEKSRWEILQQEQRLMEEKNKRKKALLAKAIAERSKRTQAETLKLKRIQKELQALDDMVSADIGILRNRIDQASLEYSYAWKRFDRAEAEYVTAKLDLQRKTEIKEQLTEHLCTIIQQNELRKAKKLEELMQQLNVQADEETLELEMGVERFLHEQEADVGKQMVHLQSPFQPSGERVTLGFAKENRNQDQGASQKVDEQCENSTSFPILNADKSQEDKIIVKDISAALTT